MSHSVGDVISSRSNTPLRASSEESFDDNSGSTPDVSRRWRLRNFREGAQSQDPQFEEESTHEGSYSSLNSKENLHSSLYPASDCDINDVVSMDSGVPLSVESSSTQDVRLEQDVSSEKTPVNIPRSLSGVMRKKAFYNARRPASINRRRSGEVEALSNDERVSLRSDRGAGDSVNSITTMTVDQTSQGKLAHMSDLHSRTSKLIDVLDDDNETSTPMARSRGVYAPIGFRTSVGARPIDFSGARQSFQAQNDT